MTLAIWIGRKESLSAASTLPGELLGVFVRETQRRVRALQSFF